MTAPIEVNDVVRSFGAVQAVAGVSFSVAPGEVVGLLGPNGAGKTTTLRVLSGLLRADRGHARIGGIDVHRRPVEARAQLGFLTSSTGLYERLTGREVISTFGRLQGLSPRRVEERVVALTAELELGAFLDKRCGAMSSGQRQRISIARAVVHDPVAYVLDEPTAALDPVASEDILELVKRAARRDKAVLFSTHRMEEAEYVCTRLLFMNRGRIVSTGTASQLLAHSGQGSLRGAFLHFAREA